MIVTLVFADLPITVSAVPTLDNALDATTPEELITSVLPIVSPFLTTKFLSVAIRFHSPSIVYCIYTGIAVDITFTAILVALPAVICNNRLPPEIATSNVPNAALSNNVPYSVIYAVVPSWITLISVEW